MATESTGSGEALLSQRVSPPEADPCFVRSREPRTEPFASFMKIMRADLGLTSGTPIGRDPASVSACRISTRACASMNGTLAALKNQGRSVSVIFTSTMPASQGPAVSTESSVGDDWL